MIDQKEMILREGIRKLLAKDFKQQSEQKFKQLLKENVLRKVIEKELKRRDRMIVEASLVTSKVPYSSTGLNAVVSILKTVLEKVLSVYRSLTSKKEQRAAFRAVFVQELMRRMEPSKLLSKADVSLMMGKKDEDIDKMSEFQTGGFQWNDQMKSQDDVLKEGVELKVLEISKKFLLKEADTKIVIGDEKPTKKAPGMLDVSDKKREEEENQAEIDTRYGGLDVTGRNFALEVAGNVQAQVLATYNNLADDVDKDTFFRWLIINFMLYFDQTDNQLEGTSKEPDYPEYEEAKQDRQEDIQTKPGEAAKEAPVA